MHERAGRVFRALREGSSGARGHCHARRRAHRPPRNLAHCATPPALVSRPNAGDAGKKATLHIASEGTGRLYYATRLSYSLTDQAAESNQRGHRGTSRIQRAAAAAAGNCSARPSPSSAVNWCASTSTCHWRRHGTSWWWMIPYPAASNPSIAISPPRPPSTRMPPSSVPPAARSGSSTPDWSEYGIELWSFYHRELTHAAARFYADYLPAGSLPSQLRRPGHGGGSVQRLAHQGRGNVRPGRLRQDFAGATHRRS